MEKKKRPILAIVLALIFTLGTVNAGASSFIFSGFGRGKGGNIDGDRIDTTNDNITKALAFGGFVGTATEAMLEAGAIAMGAGTIGVVLTGAAAGRFIAQKYKDMRVKEFQKEREKLLESIMAEQEKTERLCAINSNITNICRSCQHALSMAELAEKVLHAELRDRYGDFVTPHRFMNYCNPHDDRAPKAEQNFYNTYGREKDEDGSTKRVFVNDGMQTRES